MLLQQRRSGRGTLRHTQCLQILSVVTAVTDARSQESCNAQEQSTRKSRPLWAAGGALAEAWSLGRKRDAGGAHIWRRFLTFSREIRSTEAFTPVMLSRTKLSLWECFSEARVFSFPRRLIHKLIDRYRNNEITNSVFGFIYSQFPCRMGAGRCVE